MVSRSSCTLNLLVWMTGSASFRIGSQALALAANAGGDALIRAQRMRPARFAEAPLQRRVVGLQENQPRGDFLADFFEQGGETLERLSFANVDDQRRAPDVR